MLNIVNKYNNKKLCYGKYDCNMLWLEVFEPEVFELMKDGYRNIKQGSILAHTLTGYYSIKDFVQNNKKYRLEKNKCLAVAGDFFIHGRHVSLCLGRKTMALVNGHFKLVQTEIFTNDNRQRLYKSKEGV